MSKHILVISQCFYPESFRINDICTEWVKRGFRVTVVTGIPNYPEGKYYPGYSLTRNRRERWNGMDIIHLPVVPRGKSSLGMALNFLSFPVSEWFWKCISDIQPDTIFMFETSPIMQCLLGVWLKKKLAKQGHPVRLYAYIQDLWPENLEMVTGIHSQILLRPFADITAYIYRNCDEIFATSPSFVEEISKRAPDKTHIHFWPQYAEEFYTPLPRLPHPEIAPGSELRIFFTGNIGYAQGLEILPAAARILRSRNENVRFYIVGDGRYKNQFMDQIADIRDCFVMLDRRPPEKIPELLAWADAAFFSFMDNAIFSKTIPAKLQSYMACGVPVLASANGESERVIREAGCGFCAPLGNAAALAEVIIRFLDLPEQARNELGANSRSYYLKHFEKQKLMDEFQPWLTQGNMERQ